MSLFTQFFPANDCAPCGDDNSCNAPSIQLDAGSVFYHKNNCEDSLLTNLEVVNGTSLDIILYKLDLQIKNLQIQLFSLPYLRSLYTVVNLQQFVENVDKELGLLKQQLQNIVDNPNTSYLGYLSSDPGAAKVGQIWYNSTQSKLKIKINSSTIKEIVTA